MAQQPHKPTSTSSGSSAKVGGRSASHVFGSWMALALLMTSLPGLLHLQGQMGSLEDAELVKEAGEEEAESIALPDHSRRKPVLWLHMHKAGGTFMCSQAAKENERIISPSFNCNFRNGRFDGVPAMGKHGVDLTCKKRASMFQKTHATWGQIERHFQRNDLNCGKHFLYGTMLRKPLALIESTLNYNKFKLQKVVRWLRQRPNTTVCEEACDHSGHDSLSWQLFDNFAVRSFNGLDGWNTLPNMVTERQLETAKSWLQKMDVVTILEDLHEDYVQFESTFGWMKVNVSQKANERKHFLEIHGPPLQFLRHLNRFDIELYAFGKELARNKTAAALNWTSSVVE